MKEVLLNVTFSMTLLNARISYISKNVYLKIKSCDRISVMQWEIKDGHFYHAWIVCLTEHRYRLNQLILYVYGLSVSMVTTNVCKYTFINYFMMYMHVLIVDYRYNYEKRNDKVCTI